MTPGTPSFLLVPLGIPTVLGDGHVFFCLFARSESTGLVTTCLAASEKKTIDEHDGEKTMTPNDTNKHVYQRHGFGVSIYSPEKRSFGVSMSATPTSWLNIDKPISLGSQTN